MKLDRRSFTLVELVMVIVIIGIIAAVAIPRFVNLSRNAQIASEDGVIGALKSAIHVKYMDNAAKGITDALGGSYWPSDNPFTLLAQAPPNQRDPGTMNGDGVNWLWNHDSGYGWIIICPHYYQGGSPKGRAWFYQYRTGPPYGWEAGKFDLRYDWGH
jgi:prepilin-type N-terminal cleavage/methylation domain-containing protein